MPRKPNKVLPELTLSLRRELEDSGVKMPEGYTLYVTDTVRGRCNNRNKDITIPKWTFTYKPGYYLYYTFHEMAHAIAPPTKGDVHGPKFMAAFKSICPERLWHYELEYKPALAKAAGIRQQIK